MFEVLLEFMKYTVPLSSRAVLSICVLFAVALLLETKMCCMLPMLKKLFWHMQVLFKNQLKRNSEMVVAYPPMKMTGLK